MENMDDQQSSDSEADSGDNSPSTKRQRLHINKFASQEFRSWDALPPDIDVPAPGMAVDRKQFRKAGPYTIGTEVIGYRPVRSIVQYIGKKDDTNKFYQLKILQLSRRSATRGEHSQDEQRGKMLLHTEYSLLSLLQNEPGIIKQHEMFSDLAFEETLTRKRRPTYTGAVMKRLILVLDCLIQHPFCDKSASYISLQEHIMTVKNFYEHEALYIFYEIIKIVENIHKKNIIHRDFKLGNIVLNRSSKKVVITNFCLGRYLSNENTLLYDQTGSPAYISPDVISGKPYKGKPSDMWALGVVYFIMLFGNFPFFKSTSSALFAQIQSGVFEIPQDITVSKNSLAIIKGLLNVDPENRLTAAQLRPKLESMLAMKRLITPDQCVPLDESKVKYIISFKNFTLDEQVVPGAQSNDEQTVPKPRTPQPTDASTIEKLTQNMSRSFKTRCLKRPHLTTLQHNVATGSSSQFYSSPNSVVVSTGSAMHLTHRQSRPMIEIVSRFLRTRCNSPLPVSTTDSQNMVREFAAALDQYFASGRILPPSNLRLEDFNGIISNILALRLYRWITNEFGDRALVRRALLESNGSITSKVQSFLTFCGVKVETTVFGPQIQRNQSSRVLFILTCMLNMSGYSNTYFLTQIEDLPLSYGSSRS